MWRRLRRVVIQTTFYFSLSFNEIRLENTPNAFAFNEKNGKATAKKKSPLTAAGIGTEYWQGKGSKNPRPSLGKNAAGQQRAAMDFNMI